MSCLLDAKAVGDGAERSAPARHGCRRVTGLGKPDDYGVGNRVAIDFREHTFASLDFQVAEGVRDGEPELVCFCTHGH